MDGYGYSMTHYPGYWHHGRFGYPWQAWGYHHYPMYGHHPHYGWMHHYGWGHQYW